METDHRIVLSISIVGFIALVIGSLGYMDVFHLGKTFCYVLMVIGIVAVVGGTALMCLTKNTYRYGSKGAKQ